MEEFERFCDEARTEMAKRVTTTGAHAHARLWRSAHPVRLMLDNLNMTVNRLAERSGVPVRTLKLDLSGETKTPRRCILYARVLKVEPNVLRSKWGEWLAFRPPEAMSRKDKEDALAVLQGSHPVYCAITESGRTFRSVAEATSVPNLRGWWENRTDPKCSDLCRVAELLDLNPGHLLVAVDDWLTRYRGVPLWEVPLV